MSNEDAINILKMVSCENDCVNHILQDAIITAISALETIDPIKAERDAAVNDLKEMFDDVWLPCHVCKNFDGLMPCKYYDICFPYAKHGYWEWRGVQNDGNIIG